ncbi:MAG: diguanylate cyclase [bacterium]|nr:diguanylate cyclase [bacterium]
MNEYDSSRLNRLFASDNWQKALASFSEMAELTIKAVGSDGRLIGRSFGERNLCRHLRSTRTGLANCRSQCGRRIAGSIRQGQKTVFTCYAGLECFCTPLRADGRVIGALFGGKILTDAPDASRYVKLANECHLDHNLLFGAMGELRIGKSEELYHAMNYLNAVGETLIGEFEQSRNYAQSVSRLFTLFHLSNDLNMVMDSHELHGLIVNSLSILFDLKGCSLMLLDSTGKSVVTHSSDGPAEWRVSGFRGDTSKGILGQVFKDHAAVMTADPLQIENAGFSEAVTSLYVFPLHFGEKIGGVVSVFNSELTDGEISMIQAFCDLSVMSLQNLELRQHLKNRIGEITNLGIMTSEVGEVREIEELFHLILNRSTEIVKAEQASLMILDRTTKELAVKACKGMPENIMQTLRVPQGEGITGQVVANGTALLVKDIEQDPRTHQKNRGRYKTKSFISIPLIMKNEPVGALNMSDKSTGEAFNEDDLKIIKIFASHAVNVMERVQLYERSKEMEQVLITDHLTGVLNRRYLYERVTEEITRAQRHGHEISLMMIDVDDFKFYNDHNGHLAGDDALRSVAAIFRDTVRTIDFVARYGGEEFTVVLPQTSLQEAVTIGERLRKEVEKFYFAHEEKQPLGKFTISIGLATYPQDGKTIKELIDAADKALYRAKAGGKNRLTLFSEPDTGNR